MMLERIIKPMALIKNKPSSASPSSSSSSKGATYTKKFEDAVFIPEGLRLEDSDFADVDEIKKQALIMVAGEEKTGKTWFGTMFAPEPVRVLNYDRRAKKAVSDARKVGRDVKLAEFYMPKLKMSEEESRAIAQDILSRTFQNIEIVASVARKKQEKGTILLDTATEFSEICKLAWEGDPDKAYGKDVDFVKQQWKRVIHFCRDSDLHLVVTSRVKEIWIEDDVKSASGKTRRKATGKMTYRCPVEVAELMDVIGLWRRKKTDVGRLINKYEFEILSSLEGGEAGKVYSDREWGDAGPFIYACLKNYKGSNMEDWI
jgi:hypothetical protein